MIAKWPFKLLFVLGLLLQFCHGSFYLGNSQSHTTLTECLHDAGVEGITPVSNSWNATVLPYNLRLPYQPAAVALPTTPKQVSSALKCAQTYGVKVQPRGGGHGYGSYGLGGKNGLLVIDMNRFNKIGLDRKTNIVKVGSGVRLGNLATALFNEGGRALPHGLCPGVGIGGHATHGGFGFTSRMWGITLDKIVRLDVVLADGTITEATAIINPDLFWALRGAGSSFGIVTTFHLETVPAPEVTIQFTANIPENGIITSDQRANIFLAMQEYGQVAPKEIALRLFTMNEIFIVSGVYWGTRTSFNAAIAPFTALLPNGTTFSTIEGGWIETLVALAYSDTLEVPLTGYDMHDTFFTKSLVSTQSHPQNASVLLPFFEYLMTEGVKITDFAWWVIVDLYGGQINAASLGSSSYAHRDSLFTFQFYSDTFDHLPPYPAHGIDFMNKMVASMTDYMDTEYVRGYANYNDPTLTAAEAHQLYYGNDKWDGTPGPGEGRVDRLRRIKKQVDPNMLFWNPQAIGVA